MDVKTMQLLHKKFDLSKIILTMGLCGAFLVIFPLINLDIKCSRTYNEGVSKGLSESLQDIKKENPAITNKKLREFEAAVKNRSDYICKIVRLISYCYFIVIAFLGTLFLSLSFFKNNSIKRSLEYYGYTITLYDILVKKLCMAVCIKEDIEISPIYIILFLFSYFCCFFIN